MPARRSSWQKVHILYYIFNLELKTYNDITTHTYHTENVKKMLQLLSYMSNLQLYLLAILGFCKQNLWVYAAETMRELGRI